MVDSKVKLAPERIDWEGVAALLGYSAMTAKRLARVDPEFPKGLSFSPRKATFDPAEVRAYAALRAQEPFNLGSIRGAAEAATHAARKAQRVAAHAEQVRAIVGPKASPTAKGAALRGAALPAK